MSLLLMGSGRPPGAGGPPAPLLGSPTIQTTGLTLRVPFSRAVEGFTAGAEGFTLHGLSGGATTLAYASGEGTSVIVFTISREVQFDETGGLLDYAPGDIQSAQAVALAAVTNRVVINDSEAGESPPSAGWRSGFANWVGGYGS